ncbi:hypothetical protein [Streptomyces tricolor]|uniref:hypothetical protein n=1 Tax=Streptomyces tricolor TaxID=68277 RepID=UPI003D73661C
MIDQETEAHPLALAVPADELDPPQMRLLPLDQPLHLVEHHARARREVQRRRPPS